jgi:hypothetical protein
LNRDRFSILVEEFTAKLDRNLKREELQFLAWMAKEDEQEKDKKFKIS